MSSDVPWVLLIRESTTGTTGWYLERALEKMCNVAAFYLDTPPWLNLIRGSPLGAILNKLFRVVETRAPHLDMILVIDPVRYKIDLRWMDAPKVYYAIDSHVALHEHRYFAHVQEYDYVFVAHRDDIPKYKEIGCSKVYWLPLACDPEIHRWWKLPTKYDLVFIGKIPPGSERERIIYGLQQKLRKLKFFVGRKYLHDMARTYSQSKLVLNKSLRGDLNMRVFETLGCRRLLLTDRIANGLEELFTDGKHLVIYDSLEDLSEKVQYYLEHSDKREKIASAGQKEVYEKHTYLHRAEEILEVVLGWRRSFS